MTKRTRKYMALKKSLKRFKMLINWGMGLYTPIPKYKLGCIEPKCGCEIVGENNMHELILPKGTMVTPLVAEFETKIDFTHADFLRLQGLLTQ